MTRFKVSFDGIMDRLEELERENHRLIAERDARHQQVVWRNARIDELQTMIDAMRPMVEALATGSVIATGSANTRITGPVLFNAFADMPALHEQARAFVAAHPDTAAGEAESEGE